ncbi:MAG: hypothetical protein R3B47_20750 [Bacteroidia bacterium]
MKVTLTPTNTLTDGVQWNAENRSIGRTDKLLSAALTVEVVLKKKSGY